MTLFIQLKWKKILAKSVNWSSDAAKRLIQTISTNNSFWKLGWETNPIRIKLFKIQVIVIASLGANWVFPWWKNQKLRTKNAFRMRWETYPKCILEPPCDMKVGKVCYSTRIQTRFILLQFNYEGITCERYPTSRIPKPRLCTGTSSNSSVIYNIKHQ